MLSGGGKPTQGEAQAGSGTHTHSSCRSDGGAGTHTHNCASNRDQGRGLMEIQSPPLTHSLSLTTPTTPNTGRARPGRVARQVRARQEGRSLQDLQQENSVLRDTVYQTQQAVDALEGDIAEAGELLVIVVVMLTAGVWGRADASRERHLITLS